MRALIIVTLTVASSAFARAEDPKLPPQIQELKRLIGKWSGKGSISTGGKTHAVTMAYDCVDTTGSAGVRCKGVITGIPGFTYQFDDLWGFSTRDNLVHWYTVTNAGEVHDHRGHFDATSGYLAVEETVDGKLLSEQITFKRKPKAMTMSWVTTVGGVQRERGEIELVMK